MNYGQQVKDPVKLRHKMIKSYNLITAQHNFKVTYQPIKVIWCRKRADFIGSFTK